MEELLTTMCRNDKTDDKTLQEIIPLLDKYMYVFNYCVLPVNTNLSCEPNTYLITVV